MNALSRGLRAALMLLSLGVGSAAFAANSYFLQIPNMPGDSTVKGHEDWTVIDSFSWGVSNTDGGKAAFDDLGWTQRVDSSTPLLFVAVATGTHLGKVTLDVLLPGTQLSFFQMIFEGSVATQLSLAGSGDIPQASAAISSGTRVTMRYRPQDAKGGFGPWVEGVFNLSTNTPTITFEGDPTVLSGLFASGAAVNFDASAITMVPEPATAGLLLAGLGLTGVWRLSRRRRA